MTIASFFAGIGGLEIGLEWAGLGPTVFQCERDPYAQRVLEQHWPGVQRHDDITTLDPADIPHAEVWCGGFPCTDISIAGKQAGIIDGKHSSLWFAWLDLIAARLPRTVVVENVAVWRDWMPVVRRSLWGLGYAALPLGVSAAEVGGDHLRERGFLVAYLDRERQLQPQGRKQDERRRTGDSDQAPSLADARGEGLALAEGRPEDAGEEHRPTLERARLDGLRPRFDATLLRSIHGVPDRMADYIRCLGNAVVPQCAYVVGLRLRELMGLPNQARGPT